LPGGDEAILSLSCKAWQLREITANIVKPYIFDDASTREYQRLDLMSKILDPWTRGYLSALGVGARRRHGAAGGPELLDAVLDDDGRLGAQVASVSVREERAGQPVSSKISSSDSPTKLRR
jgi:hypothetical protein